jgi:hypothetical protein
VMRRRIDRTRTVITGTLAGPCGWSFGADASAHSLSHGLPPSMTMRGPGAIPRRTSDGPCPIARSADSPQTHGRQRLPQRKRCLDPREQLTALCYR